MQSFKSKFYPHTRKPLLLIQSYALQSYGPLAVMVMLASLYRLYQRQELLWFTLLSFAATFPISNMLAIIKMKRDLSEIFFVNDYFAILTPYDLAFKREAKAFPIALSNPVREKDYISVNYFDRVIILRAKDWESLDLIWNYLVNVPLGDQV